MIAKPNMPELPHLTRRQLLQFSGLSVLGLSAAEGQAAPLLSGAQASKTQGLQPLNRFPRMVQEYYVQRVRAIEQASLAKKRP